MHRFLVASDVLQSGTAVFDRAAARHLQTVLRVKSGERIEFFDGLGHTRQFLVDDVQRSGMSFSAAGEPVFHAAAKCRLILCVSLIKRMDWVIEKATEIGAAEIRPVETARSVVRISPSDAAAKADRWLKIAEEALRQCGGAWMPRINPPVPFGDALAGLRDSRGPVFVGALAGETRPMLDALDEFCGAAEASLFIGPEGDFSPEELEQTISLPNVRPVSLGDRVLRAETACAYGLSLLSARYLQPECWS